MRYIVEIGGSCQQVIVEESNERDAVRQALWEAEPSFEDSEDPNWKGYKCMGEIHIRELPELTEQQIRSAAVEAVQNDMYEQFGGEPDEHGPSGRTWAHWGNTVIPEPRLTPWSSRDRDDIFELAGHESVYDCEPSSEEQSGFERHYAAIIQAVCAAADVEFQAQSAKGPVDDDDVCGAAYAAVDRYVAMCRLGAS
jgi:hypothetical protein